MAKQEVVVIFDRKKVADKRGKGKVEVRVYISRTERKYISLGDVAPDELEIFISSPIRYVLSRKDVSRFWLQ